MARMTGELIDIEAVQSYYPPILRFEVRVKNDESNTWHNFGYGGEVSSKGIIGTIDVHFETFRIEPKQEREIFLVIELDYRKLDFIEEKRKKNLVLSLRLDLLGVWQRLTRASVLEDLAESMARGLTVESFEVGSPRRRNILIPQSKWVDILKKLGYGKFKIVELQLPIPSGVINGAIESFDKAKKKLNEGDYVKVLVECQNVIEKIGKARKPYKAELQELLGEKLKRIGTFQGSLEAFLGFRHDVALTKERILRKDAELALHSTLALLNYFSRRLAELKK